MPKKTASRRSRRTEKPIISNNDWEHRHLPSMQLHESEKLLVGTLTALLLFLPWALGSIHPLAHGVSTFIALTALGAALLPRHGNTHSITSGGQFKRLVSFPVFWLGLLLLAFITVQGFNTAWRIEGTEGFRLLTESSYLTWLPAGVAGGDSSPFHWLPIFATPLLAVCAAWIGITRRRSILTLLSAAVINGFFIAGYGFYQVAKNKKEILWFYEPPTQTFLSTFPHHWHGASFLTILLAASVGLAAHHYAQARRSFKRSNPSGLFIFVGLVLMLIAVFSFSLVAATLSSAIMVAFLAHIGYRELTVNALPGRKVFLATVAAGIVAIGAIFGSSIASDYIDRGTRSSEGHEALASAGEWSASWEIGSAMFRERTLFGWGAGSFPEVYAEIGRREEIESTPVSLATENAASDWIRFPAELGLVGTLLLVLIFGYVANFYLNFRTLSNPLVAFLLLGTFCGLLLGASSLVFSNLAFLTTWSLCLAFGAILIRIEQTVRSRADESIAS